MTIPDFQTLMRPLLATLDDGSTRGVKDLVLVMADDFRLSEDEREQLLPSGSSLVIRNRVEWALSHLVQAGLLTRPARGQVQITHAGRDVLSKHPERVDMKVLWGFESYAAFRTRGRQNASPAVSTTPGVTPGVTPPATVSPQEMLGQAVEENQAALKTELLARALALTPSDFERLVVRLLEAMGYGESGGVEHSGRPGDGGFDGIISQDPLGLDRIYVQAKRYAPGQTVQRPAIQGFVGALMGAQGDRGVFITTSTFSAGAAQEAERVNARVELIDGERLVGLMARHGVGVQAETTVTLHRLDEDFFEAL